MRLQELRERFVAFSHQLHPDLGQESDDFMF